MKGHYVAELFSGSKSDLFEKNAVAEMRNEAIECPEPDEEHCKALAAIPVWKPPRPEMPEWACAICRNRDHFENTVLLVQRGPGEMEFYKFLYAVKAPFYLALSKLRFADEFGIDFGASAAGSCDPPLTLWEFHCNLADNINGGGTLPLWTCPPCSSYHVQRTLGGWFSPRHATQSLFVCTSSSSQKRTKRKRRRRRRRLPTPSTSCWWSNSHG